MAQLEQLRNEAERRVMERTLTIIPTEDLKSRLQKLKQDHPEDYQTGTADALRAQKANSPCFQTQLVVPAAR